MSKPVTIFLAGKPGSSTVYIGAVTNPARAIGHINALRDPGDPVDILWSAPAGDGLDRVILTAFADYRLYPGRWHLFANIEATIAALNDLIADDRDLMVHEEAKEQSARFHAAACSQAYDAREASIEALEDAPLTPMPIPAQADPAAAHTAIVGLLKTRAASANVIWLTGGFRHG